MLQWWLGTIWRCMAGGGRRWVLVHDKLLEENTVQAPFSSSSIIGVLDKLANQTLTVCPGIKAYSYKTSIGYNLKRAVTNNCPPNSVRDCVPLFMTSHPRKSHHCAPNAFHWSGNSQKYMTSWQLLRLHWQSGCSKVAFDVLSPSSKEPDSITREKLLISYNQKLNTILKR